jgi:hypothetical protein
LKLARSIDAGDNWEFKAINADINPDYTSLAVNGNNLYIGYIYNSKLKFAKSVDQGDTWTIKTIDSAGDVGNYTSLVVNGNNIYISYYDGTNDALKLAKSIDAGNTW